MLLFCSHSKNEKKVLVNKVHREPPYFSCAACGADSKPVWLSQKRPLDVGMGGTCPQTRAGNSEKLTTELWVEGRDVKIRIRRVDSRKSFIGKNQSRRVIDGDMLPYRRPFGEKDRVNSHSSLCGLFNHCTKKEENIIYVW